MNRYVVGNYPASFMVQLQRKNTKLHSHSLVTYMVSHRTMRVAIRTPCESIQSALVITPDLGDFDPSYGISDEEGVLQQEFTITGSTKVQKAKALPYHDLEMEDSRRVQAVSELG